MNNLYQCRRLRRRQEKRRKSVRRSIRPVTRGLQPNLINMQFHKQITILKLKMDETPPAVWSLQTNFFIRYVNDLELIALTTGAVEGGRWINSLKKSFEQFTAANVTAAHPTNISSEGNPSIRTVRFWKVPAVHPFRESSYKTPRWLGKPLINSFFYFSAFFMFKFYVSHYFWAAAEKTAGERGWNEKKLKTNSVNNFQSICK